ncbi:MAG TPA: hypothetical protein VLA43_08920, partial [Longimicrobiales bacterium]|nr:hypothetical protein [Longimicrobiales bacterium]
MTNHRLPLRRRIVRLASPFLVVVAALAAALGDAGAQVIPPGADLRQLAQSLSPEEIVRRLEASGLSRAQVRDRLRRAGYDPSLADRYFDAMESGASLEAGEDDARVLDALRGIGVTLRADAPAVG